MSAPELTGAAELYLERLVQAINGDIEFCTCEAGKKYRVFLLNRRQALLEEARKDVRMTRYAAIKSHPDIENAQRKVAAVQPHTEELDEEDAPVPTIHFEQAEIAV